MNSADSLQQKWHTLLRYSTVPWRWHKRKKLKNYIILRELQRRMKTFVTNNSFDLGLSFLMHFSLVLFFLKITIPTACFYLHTVVQKHLLLTSWEKTGRKIQCDCPLRKTFCFWQDKLSSMLAYCSSQTKLLKINNISVAFQREV